MSRLKECAAVLEAADRWKQVCLIEGRSLFGDEILWTDENFRELKARYSDNLDDTSARTFWEKLPDQLAPAKPEAKRLFAEIVWVFYLVAAPNSASQDTKLQNIKSVYESSNKSLPQKHWALGDILGKGTFRTRYQKILWKEYRFIIALMLNWCSCTRAERRDLLNDPWVLLDWVYEREDADRHFSHALRFLLFPDYFEATVYLNHKKRIVQCFGNRFGEDWSVGRMDGIEIDRTLLNIRDRLEKEHPQEEVSFYRPPWREIWDPSDEGPQPPDKGPARPTEDSAVEDEVQPYVDASQPYSIDDALKDLFIEEQQFLRIVDSLREGKNVILQGPPGVGKTFAARRIAWCLMEHKDESAVEMTQFHQSYAYENFVQGWRPNSQGGFSLHNGVFFEFCRRAEHSTDKSFVFIIDEINRGNLSKIFGELLMLIEADKRGPAHAIALTYSNPDDRFSVPKNVHILGLMNTADRSLAIVDYALRRRFAFETLAPAYGSGKFRAFLKKKGVPASLIKRIVADLKKLNEAIGQDSDLGTGFAIGHSYFVPQDDFKGPFDENWRRRIVDLRIAPLLREYWFDNAERADQQIAALQE